MLVMTAYLTPALAKTCLRWASGSCCANHARIGASRVPNVADILACTASRSMSPSPRQLSAVITPRHASESGVRLTKSSSKTRSACLVFGQVKNSSCEGGRGARASASTESSSDSTGRSMKSSATRAAAGRGWAAAGVCARRPPARPALRTTRTRRARPR
eukprot:scaffold177262_cov33-Tisochrysis_lutea.AAC.3